MKNARKARVLMLLANGFNPDPRVHREACSLIREGYEVTLFAWDRQGNFESEEIVDGIKIKRVCIPSAYGMGTAQLPLMLKFWLSLIKMAAREQWDVVHCHDFDTLPPGYWIGKRQRIPVIFDAHESYHEMLGPNVHSGIKHAIAWMERFLVSRVDYLITVGTILEEEYKRRGAKSTTVVGNWKPLDDFQISEGLLRQEKEKLGIPESKLVICYIGFFTTSRGLMEMIAAVEEDPGVHLILGGKGNLEEHIRLAVAGHPNISYLGFVPPHRVPFYTALSDVVFYGLEGDYGNNRYSAPNKLFEALAAGKAMLTGNIGEIAKVVKEEQTGISLSRLTKEHLLESFQTFRQRPDTLEMYKVNALAAAKKKYNWPNAALRLIETYQAVLGNHHSSRSQTR